MQARNTQQRRRGNVLVLFALMLFVLMALAALTIDLGFALATRSRMQTGVNTAAMEGLRGRDDLKQPDPDTQRRQMASDVTALVFDDDLNPATPEPGQLGAGPVLTFSGGIALPGTAFKAAETITVGPNPSYHPMLRLNKANNPDGDMVSGTFTGTTFAPQPGGDAFLVRMRRTNDQFDPGSEESSAGPPLPFLFGRGTLLDPDTKARGISVRATAIAKAVPAISVGVPDKQLDLLGVTPFALLQSVWEGLTTATIQAQQDNTITDDKGKIVGKVLMPDAISIGQSITPPADLTVFQTFLPQGNYVPVIADAGPLQDRVIGFGFVSVVPDTGNPLKAQITKQKSSIAPANASPVFVNPLDPTAAGLVDELLQAQRKMSEPLLAVALVR